MPGTVLLLAASPVGRGCLVDAASVLPVLAAVAPPVLSGTETANVVELADPLEPQAVLTRLRAAATAPGPLTMFVTGQLQLDRRQRLPHLALARTTPATVRYTAFPWRWVADELRLRPPGSTTVFVDLHADTDTWEFLAGRPLTAGPSTELYGRVAPPPSRRTVAQPAYMRAVATLLRSGHRPSPAQLHQQALTRISGEENARPGAADLVLAPGRAWAGQPWPPAPEFTTVTAPPHAPAHPPHPPVPPPVPSAPSVSVPSVPPAPSVQLPGQAGRRSGPVSPDPHEEITAAVRDGRHDDAFALAARWEREALRKHGSGSEPVLHWMEVRADLAMFAGDAERSCRGWLALAANRLDAGQAPGAPEVESAVDRAHHQWGRIDDPARARELGAELARLRQRVPGRREGALDHVRRQLSQLQTQT
ncbi:hypothetical protein [Streptomyces sp. NBC_00151]|uniref:hypothetical protein n=1 Tax=Streptomyces sp. NBC_00151 TaxID=2975669 RepID=UPI002DDA3683|nr:hypothetical protein [Streptomyces sp. NBC_00151]WRZ40637.1 hypothetical protein OG915_22835 [Streptomyces sp. NBC_00151]